MFKNIKNQKAQGSTIEEGWGTFVPPTRLVLKSRRKAKTIVADAISKIHAIQNTAANKFHKVLCDEFSPSRLFM